MIFVSTIRQLQKYDKFIHCNKRQLHTDADISFNIQPKIRTIEYQINDSQTEQEFLSSEDSKILGRTMQITTIINNINDVTNERD